MGMNGLVGYLECQRKYIYSITRLVSCDLERERLTDVQLDDRHSYTATSILLLEEDV